VARAPAGGCWQEEIDAVLTDSVTGTCTRMGEQGLLQITMRPRKIGSRQLRRWVSLTKEGETLVACLLNPKLGKGLIP
jgi:DNA-binding MarR family transcriptional regulator